jgi:hypothetical protein
LAIRASHAITPAGAMQRLAFLTIYEEIWRKVSSASRLGEDGKVVAYGSEGSRAAHVTACAA